MYNYIKCKKELDIPSDVTEKLDVMWDDVTFLVDAIGGTAGEFLIRETGQLCHNKSERETVDSSQAGQPGVIWGGAGYCKITSHGWKPLSYTGDVDVKTSILGETIDADVHVRFEVDAGYVVGHKISKLELIDNSIRKNHDKKIKTLAINRVKEMNTLRYRLYDLLLRRPIIFTSRGVGYVASYVQDLVWKIERKLNK